MTTILNPLAHYERRMPAHMPLKLYLAELKRYMAEGDQDSVAMLLAAFRVDDHGAIAIYRES